jgi:hypothetical protein
MLYILSTGFLLSAELPHLLLAFLFHLIFKQRRRWVVCECNGQKSKQWEKLENCQLLKNET